MNKNYFVRDQIKYTSNPETRIGWKMRYDFALQYISEDHYVLDCACGLGENTHMIAQQCNKVIGADLDKHFIAYCIQKWPEIEFHCLDITKDVPFSDEQFDVIVTIETLEHLPSFSSLKSALSNFYRILKPGGYLIASGPNYTIAGDIPYLSLIKLNIRRLMSPLIDQQASWHGHYRHWTPDNFKKIFLPFFNKVTLFGQHSDNINERTDDAPYLIAVTNKV